MGVTIVTQLHESVTSTTQSTAKTITQTRHRIKQSATNENPLLTNLKTVNKTQTPPKFQKIERNDRQDEGNTNTAAQKSASDHRSSGQ